MIQHTLYLKRNYNDKINSLQFLEFPGNRCTGIALKLKLKEQKR